MTPGTRASCGRKSRPSETPSAVRIWTFSSIMAWLVCSARRGSRILLGLRLRRQEQRSQQRYQKDSQDHTQRHMDRNVDPALGNHFTADEDQNQRKSDG